MGVGTLLGRGQPARPAAARCSRSRCSARATSSAASRSGSRSGSTASGRSLFLGQVLLAGRPAAPGGARGGPRCRSSCSPAWPSCRPATSPSPASSCSRAWPPVRPASAPSTGCAAPGPRSAIVAVCVVAGCVLGVSALTGPDTQLRRLPGAGGHLARGATAASTTGVVAPDYVGNYLEARYGARGARLHRRPGRHVPGVGGRRLARAAPRPSPAGRRSSTATEPAPSSGPRTSPSPRSSSQQRLAAGLRGRRLGRVRTSPDAAAARRISDGCERIATADSVPASARARIQSSRTMPMRTARRTAWVRSRASSFW